MGQYESILRQIAQHQGGSLTRTAKAWCDGSTELSGVATLLGNLSTEIKTAWPDASGEAAVGALTRLQAFVEERAAAMKWGDTALTNAAEALGQASDDLAAVGALQEPAQPTTDTPRAQADYQDSVTQYQQQREALARKAVEAYNGRIEAASGELHRVAPEARDTIYETGTDTGTSQPAGHDSALSAYGGAGGSNATHVAPLAASLSGVGGRSVPSYAATAEGSVSGSVGGPSGNAQVSSGVIGGAGGSSLGGVGAGIGGIAGGAAGLVGGAMGLAGSKGGAALRGGSAGGAIGGTTSAKGAASSGVLGKSGASATASGAGSRPGMMPAGGSGAGAAGSGSASGSGGRGGAGSRYAVPPTSGGMAGGATGGTQAGRGAGGSGMAAGSRTGAMGAGMTGSGGRGAGSEQDQEKRRSAFEIEDDWLDDEEAGQGVLD